jgi:glycine hydroxymethyltransferase
MTPEHMVQVAAFIHEALTARNDPNILNRLQQEVADFCSAFPLHVPVTG